MEDNLQRIFSVLLSVLVFFMLPLYIAHEKKDDASYALALKITTNFVDNVTSKGYITRDMYDSFVSDLAITGNVYDIKMEHLAKKYTPVVYEYLGNDKDGYNFKGSYPYITYTPKKVSDASKEKIKTSIEYNLSISRYSDEQILRVCENINPKTYGNMDLDNYLNIDVSNIEALPIMYSNINSKGEEVGVYTLKSGDIFNVVIKNENTTIATVLFDALTFGANSDNDTRVYINYGAVVKSEEYKNFVK